MKVTSTGLVFKENVYTNQTGDKWVKYAVTRGTPAGSGYLNVWLKGRREYVHRLVCEAFNGPPPTPEHQVNHKNFNTRDNRPENLEWVTSEENAAHRDQRPRKRKASAEAVKTLLEAGWTGRAIAKELGISPSRVTQLKGEMNV